MSYKTIISPPKLKKLTKRLVKLVHQKVNHSDGIASNLASSYSPFNLNWRGVWAIHVFTFLRLINMAVSLIAYVKKGADDR